MLSFPANKKPRKKEGRGVGEGEGKRSLETDPDSTASLTNECEQHAPGLRGKEESNRVWEKGLNVRKVWSTPLVPRKVSPMPMSQCNKVLTVMYNRSSHSCMDDSSLRHPVSIDLQQVDSSLEALFTSLLLPWKSVYSVQQSIQRLSTPISAGSSCN